MYIDKLEYGAHEVILKVDFSRFLLMRKKSSYFQR